ncbi:MAG: DegV family protein [Lachnospiraceae bacterium]|nr:DegV family protein [Lachnospiraceae bacterium]
MFQVFVDSGANIPAVDVRKYGINVISFVNYVDGEKLVCFDPDLSLEEERVKGKEYYNKIRAGAEVKTSLINTADFVSVFEPVLKGGEDILYISLSSNISGTFNAARLAAQELTEEYPDRKIRLVDSLNASLAQGILAIYAVTFRDKGMDIDRIAELLTGAVPHMNGTFTVDNLKYLAHTGRIKSSVALVGNILSIKPILRGNAEGFIVQYKKCRGRKKVLDELADYVIDNIVEPEKQIIGIAHADSYADSLYVIERITNKVKVKEVINTSYDYCTGSHVGPDTIAMFFMGYDRELGGKPENYVRPEIFKYL